MLDCQLFADTYEGTPSVDFDAYLAAHRVIIALKATEGTSHIDTAHARRAREAHARGLSVIHYHFARPDLGNAPQDEAHMFVMTVRPTWAKGDYLWLDFERGVKRAVDAGPSWVDAFCTEVHSQFGATPIVYGSESTLNGVLRNCRVKGERYAPAKYGGSPSRLAGRKNKWSEQFTDGTEGDQPHTVEGIGRCDLNRLNVRVALAIRARTGRRRWRALHPPRKG